MIEESINDNGGDLLMIETPPPAQKIAKTLGKRVSSNSDS